MKIAAGHYLYRGFRVDNVSPLGWEAVDENGCGFAHAGTLGGTVALIDWEFENGKERS